MKDRGKAALFRMKRSGWNFVLILLLVLLAAWNTGTNLLYIIVGGLASFGLLSVVVSGFSLRKLRLTRQSPEAVHRGETFLVAVRVENHKLLLPAISVRIESARARGKSIGYLLKVPARRAAQLNVKVTFDKRGVHPLPPFDLVTTYPFGLFERRRRYVDKREVVVYPKVSAVRTGVVEQSGGNRYRTPQPTPDGDEFYGLREYVPGDDLRLIAWRASARLGTWIIRELARENSRYVTFVVDTRLRKDIENFEELFEEAIELVASLAVTLLKRRYSVGVSAPQASVAGAEGSGQERQILDMLARLEPINGTQEDFNRFVAETESEQGVVLHISPDPREWGRRSASGDVEVLDPREVMHV